MPKSGALVISIDYELLWGVRDHLTATSCYAQQNILGERVAIPRLLDLFDVYGVRTTWAVVGLACLGKSNDRVGLDPLIKPDYRNKMLSPYLELTGTSETDDPLHFGESMVRQVMSRNTHEIASHTYSHYYCMEPGQDKESFAADCKAFSAVSSKMGFRARSIVFPRNQSNPAYTGTLLAEGIDTYRGNPAHWAYASVASAGQGIVRRAARLIDACLPIGGDRTYGWDAIEEPSGMNNVRASFFLRPSRHQSGLLDGARISRIKKSMQHAAKQGRLVHLWFHPHNVGVDIDANISNLTCLLDYFSMLKEQFGMLSLTMADVASRKTSSIAT